MLTFIQIVTLIVQAIQAVVTEISQAAGVGCYVTTPSALYSQRLYDRLAEELAVVQSDPYVTTFRIFRDSTGCWGTAEAIIVIEFIYWDGTQLHQVRHEVPDQFYVSEG